MKTILLSLFSILASLPLSGQKTVASKPYRIIVSSDFSSFPITNSDPDDVQSIVRFLL